MTRRHQTHKAVTKLPPPWCPKSWPKSVILSYDCAESLILQGVAAVYWVAFLAAWYQNQGLLGDDGILPVRKTYWEPMRARFDSSWKGFQHAPSIFWWIPLSDTSLQMVAGAGLFLSTLILVTGQSTWLWQGSLWLLYFSIVSVAEATSFYAYGWESQLLETGFLSIFLCVLPGVYQGRLVLGLWPSFCSNEIIHGPTPVTRWLYRWLMFRITMGAGLIKLRGSSCWTQKTCLYYHFETQPIPSPLSFFYHFLPVWVHRRMIIVDFLVQVYTCWFVLVPPVTTRFTGSFLPLLLRTGGFLQIGLMVGIIFSGNFAFLNHLTIIPALACLDDLCWPQWLQLRVKKRKQALMPATLWRRAVDVTLLCAIGYLSWPVVSNLWGKGQVMNRSFDSFRLVNTYGAFGSVGTKRYEPIISVSSDATNWIEVDFPCKPGAVYRRPCFCAPYHYRLDWNIWFIGFKPHAAYLQRRERWLYSLVAKLLQSSNGTDTGRPWLKLLDADTATYLSSMYYSHGQAPRYAKVDMYRYRMTGPLSIILNSKAKLPWWNRTLTEPLIPMVQWNQAQERLEQV